MLNNDVFIFDNAVHTYDLSGPQYRPTDGQLAFLEVGSLHYAIADLMRIAGVSGWDESRGHRGCLPSVLTEETSKRAAKAAPCRDFNAPGSALCSCVAA